MTSFLPIEMNDPQKPGSTADVMLVNHPILTEQDLSQPLSDTSSEALDPSSLPKHPPDAMIAKFGQAPGMAPQPTADPLLATHHFNPIPTTPGKCSKLKLNVFLDSTVFVAGGTVHGRLEMIAQASSSLYLGEIAVELCAYEEIKEKSLASCQVFLTARIVFQGQHVPPSNAVRGPQQEGYWLANKGKTTFPFAFRIPEDAPSCYTFQRWASLRYVVTGVAMFKHKGKSDTLFKSRDAFVVESWNTFPSQVPTPLQTVGQRRSLFRQSGDIQLHAAIQKPVYASGTDLYLEVRVKNDSGHKVQGLRLNIIRKLLILQSDQTLKIMMENVHEKSYRQKSFYYDPGEERSNLSHLRTIRHTALAEVGCFLTVTLNMGLFSKDISLELPISICHSASLEPPKELDLANNLHPQQYNIWNELRLDPELYKPFRQRKTSSTSSAQELFDDLEQRSRSFDIQRNNIIGIGGKKPVGRMARKLPWSEDTESSFDAKLLHHLKTPLRATSLDLTRADGKEAPLGILRGQRPLKTTDHPLVNHSMSWAEEHSQEPSLYIPANERSKRLAKSSKLFYEGLSAEISVIPDDMYTFNTDCFTQDPSLPRQAPVCESILLPEHTQPLLFEEMPNQSGELNKSYQDLSFISTLTSLAKQFTSKEMPTANSNRPKTQPNHTFKPKDQTKLKIVYADKSQAKVDLSYKKEKALPDPKNVCKSSDKPKKSTNEIADKENCPIQQKKFKQKKKTSKEPLSATTQKPRQIRSLPVLPKNQDSMDQDASFYTSKSGVFVRESPVKSPIQSDMDIPPKLAECKR